MVGNVLDLHQCLYFMLMLLYYAISCTIFSVLYKSIEEKDLVTVIVCLYVLISV